MRPESAAILWDVHSAATRVAEFIVGLDEAGYATDSLRRSQESSVSATFLPTVMRSSTTPLCGAPRRSALRNC
jgi:hypothetical protein